MSIEEINSILAVAQLAVAVAALMHQWWHRK